MQAPLQQLLGVFESPGEQVVSPVFLQGFVQADISAHVFTPVSYRSVQHPVEHSFALLQGLTQALDVPLFTQVRPSQQLVDAQLAPSALQSPASAAGLWQPEDEVFASPVQKHEAWSKVMHV